MAADPRTEYLAHLQALRTERKWLRTPANRPRRPRKVYFDGMAEPVYIPGPPIRYGGYKRRRSYGGFRRSYRSYGRRYRGGYGRRYRGRGGYFADLLGKAAGAVGSFISPAVRFAGGDTSNWGSSVTKWGEGLEQGLFNRYMGRPVKGTGAYGIGATDAALTQEVPTIMNAGQEGCIVVNNKEYLGDITSKTAFTQLFNFVLNPGHPNFPWLSKIAQNFSQYQWLGLIFHFRSTSGSLSTSQALGEVIGAANYNTYEPAPTNKTEMLNQVFAKSGAPCSEILWPIETAGNQTTAGGLLSIRGAGTPAQGDLRLYDLGKFYVAVHGQPANDIALGELWVTYNVALCKPQLPTQTISAAPDAHYTGVGVTAAFPLGSTSRTAVFDGIGLTMTGNTITFPPLFQGTVWLQVYTVMTSTRVEDLINQAYVNPGTTSWNNMAVFPSAGIQQIAVQTTLGGTGYSSFAPAVSTSIGAGATGTTAGSVAAKHDITFSIPQPGVSQNIVLNFSAAVPGTTTGAVVDVWVITGVQLQP